MAKSHYFSNNVGGEDILVATESPKGAHGHSPSNPLMDASFIAYGAGIKPGTVLDKIGNIDVAPTIGHLLGVEMKDVDGKVLKEILLPASAKNRNR